MKNSVIVLIVIVVVLLAGGLYLGRHQLKTLMGGNPQPAAQMMQPTKTPTTAMAPSDNIYLTKTDKTKGNYLTDFAGMTLYVFDKDTVGVSNCTAGCATLWPPYTSGATAESQLPANITVITRADGSKQFAWKGMPLYYYSKDTKAGDILGDGIGGIWHIVTP